MMHNFGENCSNNRDDSGFVLSFGERKEFGNE